MRIEYARRVSRRRFLEGLTLTGTAGLLGLHARRVAAEPPPETTTLRLVVARGSICAAPMFLAEDFLPGEGFTEVQYLKTATIDEQRTALASTEGHFTMLFSAPSLILIEAGTPLVLLAGVHVGCLELFGTDRVRTIRDLKGKSVAVWDLGGPGHTFVASMATYVGLDPRHDIHWVVMSRPEAVQRLAEGKIDALLA
jgi:NitT/TauT family transport system substrate-binding protein